MNKPPRFMMEYFNYQLKCITGNKDINAGIRLELIRRLEKTMVMFKRGYITIDETMRLLSMPDNCENMEQFII